VGAGRAGRSLHRELRETPGERTVGFLDDNPRLRRRRVQGIAVHGTLADAARALARTRADRVLVAIPDAPRERVELVVAACREAGVPCGFVRREIYGDRDLALSATAE
jgi:FlaA1/EpsC-like NDP-sugar epimerase